MPISQVNELPFSIIGSYLSVSAAEASFRKVRLVTPFFGAYGRKKACFKFDVFFNGGGAVSLDIMVHNVYTSKLIMSHVEKKEEWQSVAINVDLEGDIKVIVCFLSFYGT